ncbi:DUF2225 domain-containing protein [Taibaiella chishuiensis]|uniref:Uncharacterized protein DUF2225 n=1 Tax=Taibaiella chishuiensis TaxID=1434707 RepID=A0A2P8CWZ4_9BACT|nr:DUF2225 domain-containing protein [Taibaiella chishuiensis]PSK89493.1 uncharacterized protein DUF2225 [Taibaiella chishuiensis]
MKNILRTFLLTAGLLIPLLSYSHVAIVDSVKCPVDGYHFEIEETVSYTVFGTLADFQKVGGTGYMYELYVHACPRCHYSGSRGDMDTVLPAIAKRDLLKLLIPYRRQKMTPLKELEIAIGMHKYFKRSDDDIANLYLVASYLLKTDTQQTAKRKALQLACASYFIKALDNKAYSVPRDAEINYLVGDLYRRVGDFDKAIVYYDRADACPEKPEELQQWLIQQRKLAMNKDDDNSI